MSNATRTDADTTSAARGTDKPGEEHDLGAAGAQLSTAPREESLAQLTALGVIGWARWFWRQLTSMRIALLLLLLLSLAAIPGSLIPQTGADEFKVAEFRRAHTTLAPLYDKLQLFHVYSSVWFSAIYILLFVSLIGCIVPRTWQFIGQLRSRPPRAPRNLARLPAYTTWQTAASEEEARAEAQRLLKQRRFRVHVSDGAVCAEKGYLREAGNLVFHVALIVMLVAFACGELLKSEGGKLVVEGDGFSNTLTQYDDFKSGSLYDTDDLAPFSFTLDKFEGTYERSGSQKGTARTYRANVTYTEGVDGKPKTKGIEVNSPLHVDGATVYLIGHGYAPVVTVRDGRGEEVYRQAVPLLPIDSNTTSTGAIKVLDGYKDKNGKKEQLGFNAFFVPTFAGVGKGQMFSQFPGLDFPVLALSAYHGSLGVDSGMPQNVYQLNTKKMQKFKDAKGELLKQRLLPGETMKLPNGAGSITFEKEIKQWASFQISQQPGNDWALGGAIAAIAGLSASLFIQRRRVWVRTRTGEDGLTVVEMAGLGRSESGRLGEEIGALSGALHEKVPTATADEAADKPTDEAAGRASDETADKAVDEAVDQSQEQLDEEPEGKLDDTSGTDTPPAPEADDDSDLVPAEGAEK